MTTDKNDRHNKQVLEQVIAQEHAATESQHAGWLHRLKESLESHETRMKATEIVLNVLDTLLKLHKVGSAVVEQACHTIPVVGGLVQGVGFVAMGVSKAFGFRHQAEVATHAKLSVGVKTISGLAMIAAAIVGLVFPPLGASMLAVIVGISFGVTLYKAGRTAYKLQRVKLQQRQLTLASSTSPSSELSDAHQAKLTATLIHQRRKARSRAYSIALGAISVGLVVGLMFTGPVGAAVLLSGLIAMNTAYVGKKYGVFSRIKRLFGRSQRRLRRRTAARQVAKQTLLGPQPRVRPQAKVQLTEQQRHGNKANQAKNLVVDSSEAATINNNSHPELKSGRLMHNMELDLSLSMKKSGVHQSIEAQPREPAITRPTGQTVGAEQNKQRDVVNRSRGSQPVSSKGVTDISDDQQRIDPQGRRESMLPKITALGGFGMVISGVVGLVLPPLGLALAIITGVSFGSALVLTQRSSSRHSAKDGLALQARGEPGDEDSDGGNGESEYPVLQQEHHNDVDAPLKAELHSPVENMPRQQFVQQQQQQQQQHNFLQHEVDALQAGLHAKTFTDQHPENRVVDPKPVPQPEKHSANTTAIQESSSATATPLSSQTVQEIDLESQAATTKSKTAPVDDEEDEDGGREGRSDDSEPVLVESFGEH